MNQLIKMDEEYRKWIEDIGKRYKQRQIKASVSVNQEMIGFYWSIGRDIVEKSAESKWGSGFFVNLSKDMRTILPGVQGLSSSNLRYRRASRVSMGTVFQIPWTFIQDDKERRCDRKEIWPVQAIESLKALGYKTAALALTDDSVSIDDPQLMSEEKLAVILGTEGDGLMQETIKACDYTVKIPMSHGVDSLNVAAASAVAFWQLRK